MSTVCTTPKTGFFLPSSQSMPLSAQILLLLTLILDVIREIELNWQWMVKQTSAPSRMSCPFPCLRCVLRACSQRWCLWRVREARWERRVKWETLRGESRGYQSVLVCSRHQLWFVRHGSTHLINDYQCDNIFSARHCARCNE